MGEPDKKNDIDTLSNRGLLPYFLTSNTAMVEIFKTNVRSEPEASQTLKILQGHFPGYALNFDLEDRDKILRVEAQHIEVEKILTVVISMGIACDWIED